MAELAVGEVSRRRYELPQFPFSTRLWCGGSVTDSCPGASVIGSTPINGSPRKALFTPALHRCPGFRPDYTFNNSRYGGGSERRRREQREGGARQPGYQCTVV